MALVVLVFINISVFTLFAIIDSSFAMSLGSLLACYGEVTGVCLWCWEFFSFKIYEGLGYCGVVHWFFFFAYVCAVYAYLIRLQSN